MIPLYPDEDSLSHIPVRLLRAESFDILTAAEALQQSQSDAHQLAFATLQRRCIYTANTGHFAQLHTEWLETGQHHAGIIILTEQRTPAALQVGGLLRLMRALTPNEMQDRLEFLGPWIRGKDHV